MDFHVTDRQQGKTDRLLEWFAAGDDRVIITHDESEANRVRELIGHTSPARNRVVAVSNIASLRGTYVSAIGVDNLDLILPQLLGVFAPVDRVTATGTLI